ncbi:MAG: SBBP repeat-containing protein [Bryobacterales bacterium]|nr:SBBP repeat-containing protein [Bryobacterales bacterium]
MRVAIRPLAFAVAALLSLSVWAAKDKPPAKNAPRALTGVAREQVASSYGRLPMRFEPSGDGFTARGAGYGLSVRSNGVALTLRRPSPPRRKNHVSAIRAQRTTGSAPHTVAMHLEATREPRIAEPVDKLPGYSNYLLGADETKWVRNVPQYARVRYRDVYDGIDVVYYGNQQRLEYDFVVKPNADPDAIRIRWEGIDDVRIASNGDLVLVLPEGELRQLRPQIYQESGGKRVPVEGAYRLLAGKRVAFTLARYDHRKPLIIDPVMAYANYLGGSGIDAAHAIAVDAAGNAYVAGGTESANFRRQQTTAAYQNAIRPPITTQYGNEQFDGFVVKINPEGTAILYATYLGGTDYDWINGIAVDSSGNAYVCGETFSSGGPNDRFPAAGNGAISAIVGDLDAFVAKLNPAGTALVYSTYLGTNRLDEAYSLAVSGNSVFVTGRWAAVPVQGQTVEVGDAFIARYGTGTSAAREAISTFGGAGNEIGFDIAADSLGNLFVTGRTGSAGLQTNSTLFRGVHDAFLARFNTSLQMQSFTYLGGSGEDDGISVAVGPGGEAFVTGETNSSGLGDTTYGRNGTSGDAFVARFSPSGMLTHFGYFGGSRNDFGDGIAVDPSGTAYVAGFSESSDFPVSPFAAQRQNGGQNDVFVIRVAPQAGSIPFNLLFSTYFGGFAEEGAGDIAVSPAGEVFVAGSATAGPNNTTVFPSSATPPILNPAFGGGFTDAFVAKLASASVSFNLQSSFGPPSSGPASTSNFAVYRTASATNQSRVAAESCGTTGSGGSSGLPNCANCLTAGAGQTVTTSFQTPATGSSCTPLPVRAGCETNNADSANNEAVYACPSINPAECAPTFASNTVQIDRNGGDRDLTVELSAQCSWTAASDNSFVTIMSPGFSGNLPQGRGTLRLRIAPNNTGAARSARIVASSVATREVRIEQSAVSGGGSSSPLTASPAVIRFLRTTTGTPPGPVTLSVSSSPNATFQASASPAWLSVAPGGGTTPASVQVSAATASLGVGTHSGQVALTAAGQTINVPATLVIFAPGTTSQIFSDVPAPHPWIDFIFLLNRFGVTVGCRETPLAYCPADTVTQAQMAAFIIRALFGENFSYPTTPYFNDMPASNSLFKYVQKMREQNINLGCGGPFFCPNSTVNRGQMATYIARALYGESYAFPANARFSDIPASSGLFQYVQKIWEIGVTQGCTTTDYCPGNPVTREQMSAFLSRSFFGYGRLTP